MRRIGAYVPASILFAGCALLWHAHSQAALPLDAPLAGVLSQVDGYEVTDQTFSDAERRVAGMTDYVARAYRRDTTVVFSTLVSYYDKQAQGKTIHSPRNCLPGAGWEILTPGTRTLAVDGSPHVVNSYVLKNGSNTALTYYWYQGRGRVSANEYMVKWNLLRDATLLGHTEEALVRVIVPIRSAAADSLTTAHAHDRAFAIGDDIAARLIREVNLVLPNGRGRAPASRVSAARGGAAVLR